MDNDGVADPDILALDFGLVVQGGHLDGATGDDHWCKHRDRSGSACPADRHEYIDNLGRRLLGGVFEGHGGPWRLTDDTEPLIQDPVVDLDDQPIGVER